MRSPEYIMDCLLGGTPLEDAELTSEYKQHQANPQHTHIFPGTQSILGLALAMYQESRSLRAAEAPVQMRFLELLYCYLRVHGGGWN